MTSVNPRPFTNPKPGPQLDAKSTAWDAADRFAREVEESGELPSQIDGRTQRQRLLELARLKKASWSEKDPVKKAALDAEHGELLTLHCLAAHARKEQTAMVKKQQ